MSAAVELSHLVAASVSDLLVMSLREAPDLLPRASEGAPSELTVAGHFFKRLRATVEGRRTWWRLNSPDRISRGVTSASARECNLMLMSCTMLWSCMTSDLDSLPDIEVTFMDIA